MLNLEEKCKKCRFCENFYGPCFDGPICITCHLFIFPNVLEDIEPSLSRMSDSFKKNSSYLSKFNGSANISNFNCKTPSSFQDITLKFTRSLEKLDSNDSGNEDIDDSQQSNDTDRSKITASDLNPNFQNKNLNVNCKFDKFKKLNNLDDNSNKIQNLDNQSNRESTNLIEKLPNEVLLKIFINLDDLSLWSVSQVCKRWFLLIREEINDEKWRYFIGERWIYCKPQINIDFYQEFYSQLVKSSNCFYCLQQIQNRPKIELSDEFKRSWRHRRLLLELKSLQQDPPDGINAKPLDSSCYFWQAAITGPVGSPYEGGIFYLYLQIPQSYPLNPPLVRFITRIFHPNISRHGDIGLDSIHENWSLALTISKILISIQSLLTDPYTHVCMERDIGELYKKNKDSFDKYARIFTWKYAMNDYLCFNDLKIINDLNFYVNNE